MPAASEGTPESGGASSAPVRQTRDERWLNGLGSLQQQMNNAIQAGVITPASLRQEAARLRRCTPALTALGPPGHLWLRPAYRQARRACDAFARAAKSDMAAARAYTTSPSGQAKLNRLLNESDTAVNSGLTLIADAASIVPLPPGG
jgi:hypothetical protein